MKRKDAKIAKALTLVNQTTAGDQEDPSVDMSEDGLIGIAWRDSNFTGRIMMRLFDTAILAPPIFSDGFESGDTSSWSVTTQ